MRLPGAKKKLMREGAQAKGVVTKVKETMRPASGGKTDYAIDLLVRYPDGSERELEVHGAAYSPPSVGDMVPLRYDPNDPSDAVIDTDLIESERGVAQEVLEERRLAEAKRKLRGEAETPMTEEEMAKMEHELGLDD